MNGDGEMDGPTLNGVTVWLECQSDQLPSQVLALSLNLKPQVKHGVILLISFRMNCLASESAWGS